MPLLKNIWHRRSGVLKRRKMSKTKIDWATDVWNPVTGCSHAGSPGCDHCYAKRMSKRLAGRFGYPKDDPFRVTIHSNRFHQPMEWNKPRRIFVCSMADLFHDEMRKGNFTWKPWERVYHIFYTMMHLAKQHTYLLLTKRPENMLEFMNMWIRPDDDISNIHFGVSIEDQKSADERLPWLMQTPVAVRWVSYEPALELVDFNIKYRKRWNKEVPGWEMSWALQDLNWLVMGAETGSKARPFDIEWGRYTRNQCKAAGVPFFFKSAGKQETPLDLQIREFRNEHIK